MMRHYGTRVPRAKQTVRERLYAAARGEAAQTAQPAAAARSNSSAARAIAEPAAERPSILLRLFIWTLVVFTVVPEGFNYAAMQGQTSLAVGMPTQGSPMSRTIWLILLGFGLAVAASRSIKALNLFRNVNRFFLLFLALALVSVVWSIEPAITLRRVIRASTIMLDGVAIGLLGWRLSSLQSVLRPVLLALMIGSIIFVLAEPTMAVEQLNQAELVGAWRGLCTQKNGLGGLSAISVILWLHAWLSKESNRFVAVIGVVASATCLVHSRSSTSLMAAVFACGLMVMLLRSPPGLRRYLPYIIGVFAALLLIYSLAVLDLVPGSGLLLSPVTALTGKDQTFSGRTAIWAIIREHISYRPLLGSGYGAYWVQEAGSPSMEVLQRLYFYPTEGHDGYLDVINDLGFVGGAVLLAYLVAYLRQGLRIFSVWRNQGALYLSFMFMELVGNLSESHWFNTLTSNFVMMTLATMAMGRTMMDLRARAAQRAPAGAGGGGRVSVHRPMTRAARP